MNSQRPIRLAGKTYTTDIKHTMLAGKSSEEIERDILAFINKNPDFNLKIRKLLYQRLKVATGKLISSIKFGVDAKVRKKDKEITIDIGVFVTDRELINALLGEKELDERKNLIKVPTIHQEGNKKYPSSELIEYIKAKMKYYREMLLDIEKNILNRQRKKLIEERDSKRKNKFQDDDPGDKYRMLAIKIRSAMQHRKDSGMSPLKGSEYAFLGYSKTSQGRNTYYTPSYTKFKTPLWTSSSGDGEINQAISLVVSQWFDSFMAETVSKDYKQETILDSLLRVHSRYKDIHGVGNQFFDLADRYVKMIGIIRGTDEGKRTPKESRLLNKLVLAENKKKLHDMGLEITVDYKEEIKFAQIRAAKKVTAELERILRNQRNRRAKRISAGTLSNMKKRRG